MPAEDTSKPKLLLPALVVALVLPIVPVRVVMGWMVATFHMPEALSQAVAYGWVWALGAIVLFYVLAIERRPLSSVGLGKFTWGSFAWGVGAWIASYLFVGGILIGLILPRLNLIPHSATAALIQAMPFWLRLLIVIRAGFVEEFLFRGFGIERLEGLTGSRVLAGAATLASFTLSHISYFSVGQLIIAAGVGLVLTLVYLLRRDLWANIIAHFLTDAVSVLLR